MIRVFPVFFKYIQVKEREVELILLTQGLKARLDRIYSRVVKQTSVLYYAR